MKDNKMYHIDYNKVTNLIADGYSISDLCLSIGIGQTTYNRWMKGGNIYMKLFQDAVRTGLELKELRAIERFDYGCSLDKKKNVL